MVERQLPKLHPRVRFPSPAPIVSRSPASGRAIAPDRAGRRRRSLIRCRTIPGRRWAACDNRPPPWRRPDSGHFRHLIEKAGDAPDATVYELGEVGALDRAVDIVGTKPPAETEAVAVAIGIAYQAKTEIGEAGLHPVDQRLHTVMPVAAHQRIDIDGILGPVGREQLAPSVGYALIPQRNVVRCDRVHVGHDALLLVKRNERSLHAARTESITSEVITHHIQTVICGGTERTLSTASAPICFGREKS